jgi:membrane glycosyltransferase
LSRWHLLRGVAAYLAAPLWLALLLMSALLPLRPDWGISDVYRADQLAAAGVHAGVPIAAIFAVSIAFLIAPKLMAYGAMLAQPKEREAFGGAGMAFVSMLLEILLSALMAPVLMLNQIWGLISIVTGHDSGWKTQARDEGKVSFDEAADRHLGDTGVGIVLGAAAWGASGHALLWILPVIAGMVGCIPLAVATSSCALGDAARRAGLLVIPEERDAPPVVAMYNRLSAPPAAYRPASAASAKAWAVAAAPTS